MPPSTPVDEGARREDPEIGRPADDVIASGEGVDAPAADRGSRFPWLPIALGVVGLLAVGAGLYAFLRSSGGGTGPAPRPTAGPTRVAFAFPDPVLTVRAFGAQPSASSAKKVGESVRSSLSSFYDGGFVDPQTWTDGPPADLWEDFEATAANRAKDRASSLTLGREPDLERLEVTRAVLRVTVLFDGQRRPQSVIASVVFRATGDLRDGSLLDVRSEASFLFRAASGRWVITGFPTAKVTLDSDLPVTPSPSPSVSASASAGATP
ncbi:MAG TPA: hypothetical protein VKA30_06180 [Actinomycetota bacterium]|nr:hypothetical protein [Actinomycetota bacterium]